MNGRAPSGREWLNTKEAAEYACIGYDTFTRWQRAGKLPFVFFGGIDG
jgi:excisionase family DNA binding protein